jgi:hypothetical protein
MLVLLENDLRVLKQVLDDVCAAREAVGRSTHRGSLSLMALELYRKGFKKPETLVRLLDRLPTDKSGR